jgi:hypothetical protein
MPRRLFRLVPISSRAFAVRSPIRFFKRLIRPVDKLIGDIDNSSWQPAGILDKDTGFRALSQFRLVVLAKRQGFEAPKLVCIQKSFWAA